MTEQYAFFLERLRATRDQGWRISDGAIRDCGGRCPLEAAIGTKAGAWSALGTAGEFAMSLMPECDAPAEVEELIVNAADHAPARLTGPALRLREEMLFAVGLR